MSLCVSEAYFFDYRKVPEAPIITRVSAVLEVSPVEFVEGCYGTSEGFAEW
jgi:hypothetical protein